jgi:hypothetical protein
MIAARWSFFWGSVGNCQRLPAIGRLDAIDAERWDTGTPQR